MALIQFELNEVEDILDIFLIYQDDNYDWGFSGDNIDKF